MTGSLRQISAVVAALVVTGSIAACGGGPALDDGVNAGAKLIRQLNQGIKQPATRVAGRAASVDTGAVMGVMRDAFCEGIRIYVQEDRFPTGQEWQAIAVDRLGSLGVPYHAAVSQAVSLYESLAYGLQTGEFDWAEVELYCL
jgi:hypothetical protein